jgi:membrane protease YdiL (CAAX protease family)
MGLAIGSVAAAVLPYHSVTRQHGSGLAVELIVVAVLQAAPEEYLFRGLLTPALSRTIGPLTPVVDGILFASAYGASRSWPLLALVLLCGVAASWVRRRFDTAAPTVVAHVCAAVVALALVPHLP